MKVSTVFPRGERTRKAIAVLAHHASTSDRSVQLQVSLISTDERYRREMAGPLAAPFSEIRTAAEEWRAINPKGRKFNLSLILAEETPASAEAVRDIFPPELFRFRFRNYVPTAHGNEHGLTRLSDMRLASIKNDFRNFSYEVTDHATPTETEWRFGLASNVTLSREGGTRK